MVKVRIIPNGEVRMPGSEKTMPQAGVVVELTTYWQRLAEAGTVRIAPDDDGQAAADGGGKPSDDEAAAGEAAAEKPAGKKAGGKPGK